LYNLCLYAETICKKANSKKNTAAKQFGQSLYAVTICKQKIQKNYCKVIWTIILICSNYLQITVVK